MVLNDTRLQRCAIAGLQGNRANTRAAPVCAGKPVTVDSARLLRQSPVHRLTGAQGNELFLAAVSQFRRHLPFDAL